jgi:putative sigma-54 modulation protein
MKFNIRGEKILVTNALREYVERKLNRLERYLDPPLAPEAHVTLSVAREVQSVEVTIPLHGFVLRAEEKGADMYASIDLVVDKLERQIRKHKTKVSRKIREESGMRELPSISGALAHVSEEEEMFELVRTKRFELKPMDVEEAILQMNMVGHNFFVFSDANTKKVNVVYRRDDGRYGLIEPAM